MGEEQEDSRSYRWAKYRARILTAVLACVIVGGGIAVGVVFGERTVSGVAVANASGVVDAKAERRKAAEIAAAEEKARLDAAFLANLEVEVLASMRDYYADPANDLADAQIVVRQVSLVKIGDNRFDGMARMSAFGNDERDILVHVTADDRNFMWSTDKGGLMPLIN